MISEEELNRHIRGCALNKRESQKKIYETFFGFGMAICNNYTKRNEDSVEVLNDSFLKIFKEIHRFEPAYDNGINSFKGWLRKIIIYTAIDHGRKYNKHYFNGDSDKSLTNLPVKEENAVDAISYHEIIYATRKLSPAYRSVLNLFIVHGFSHEEIAKLLGITAGTSKSNLSKARHRFKQILEKDFQLYR